MRLGFENWVIKILEGTNLTDRFFPIIIELLYLLAIVLVSLLVYLISKIIIINLIKKFIKGTDNKWDDSLIESGCIHKALNILPGILFYSFSFLLPTFQNFIEIIAIIYISIMTYSALSTFLDAINLIYEKNYRAARVRPIKGVLKVFKFVAFSVALIIVMSRLMGQTPIYIISGLGALSAIILLIFRDAILGLVAGFQMASNDMVRIGDWIEMPKYEADGDVIDISLTVVKVENFDRTITTIPAYALVSDSFKNWRGMQNAGGRRIKRSIFLDVSSVEFCSDELIQSLAKIEYLKCYLKERKEEIAKHNEVNNIDISSPVNGRRLTNLGVFRKYIMEYLKNHPKIHKDMIIMVRQLSMGKEGVPLEVYAFTNDTKWENYESIMSDIFDHLFAVVHYFGLKIFQEPTGSDIKSLKQ